MLRFTTLALGLVLASLPLFGRPAVAQDDNPPDWTLLDGSPQPARSLGALASGALTVSGSDGLSISDDGGATWRQLANPPDGQTIAVAPSDPRVLYAWGSGGLERSPGAGGGAWTVIRAVVPSSADTRAPPFAVDPVDPDRLFLVEKQTILRSTNGGAAWQPIFVISGANGPCQPSVQLVIPHPTDPLRLFTDAGCYAGRDEGTQLEQTRDDGATWPLFIRRQEFIPRRVAGGFAARPGRWYVSADAFQQVQGASVFRSDDDGQTWSTVLQTEHSAPVLGGLAADPANPDTVWAAVGRTNDASTTGVRVSADGGQTWAFLGRQDIGWVNDLSLARDGSALFAATNEGIWRFSFAPPPDAHGAAP